MIYTLYMWTVIVFAVFLYGTILGLSLPVARKGRLYKALTSGWGSFIVRCSGVRVEVRGIEKLDPQKPYVFMTNHQTYMDVIVLLKELPHAFRFVAKKELVYIPIFGQLMWATGHVIVNRSKRENSLAGMQKAAQKVRGGTSILFFPEGTRSPNYKVGPFKKGGFMLALEAEIPIVPMAITGTHPMMPKGRFKFEKSDVTITVADPIPTAGMGQERRDELMERTRRALIGSFPQGTKEYEANKNDESLKV